MYSDTATPAVNACGVKLGRNQRYAKPVDQLECSIPDHDYHGKVAEAYLCITGIMVVDFETLGFVIDRALRHRGCGYYGTISAGRAK